MDKKYKKLLKVIKKYENIVIVRHDVPDYDASGSQFGLAEWIKNNYKNKCVYCVGKPHLFFSPSLYPCTDDVDLSEKKYLCIVVDVANLARVDGLKYIENADYVVKIDHHPDNEHYGNLSIVEEHAAAASELIGDFIISTKKKISQECANYLYSGIVGDSGGFQYAGTSPRTLLVASQLLKTNFDFRKMYEKMYVKSIDDLKIVQFIYNKYKITDHGVAYYMVSQEDLDNLGILREKVKAFVNIFSNYREIKIWVQFSEDCNAKDDYKWRVSIRSRNVKINDVASKYNGGGHDNASGAKCRDFDEMEHLINDLDELLK